jgi:two-component system sensor histidine kinase QseC
VIRGRSLRWQLLGAMVLIFAFGVGATWLSYRSEVMRLGDDLWNRTLQEQAREFLAGLRVQGNGAPQLDLPPAWRNAYADQRSYFAYTLFDAAGRPLTHSPNLSAPLPFFPIPKDKAFAPINIVGIGPTRRAIVAARAPGGDVLVVARRDIARERLVDSLFEEGSEQLLVLAPFVVLALGLMWAITWWSLRPINLASREAAAVGPTNPAVRISAEALPREIQPLVAAVNGALGRLTDAYSRERRMTADAAHALRTPLAALSLRLQRARRSGAIDWPVIERELAEMSALVGQLLDLARKESLSRRGDIATLPVVNLSRIVREAAANVVPLIEGRGRRLEIDAPEAVPVHGHGDDLRDLVRNLLENALWHGRGTVSVRVRRDSGAPRSGIVVEVADEGGGVPAGMEEEAFERFRKLHSDSPGAGLGLAIVRQVARSHGGDARFVPGAGRVIVWLPNPLLGSSAARQPATVESLDEARARAVSAGPGASASRSG